jgi:hypothetical protein
VSGLLDELIELIIHPRPGRNIFEKPSGLDWKQVAEDPLFLATQAIRRYDQQCVADGFNDKVLQITPCCLIIIL